jgi:flagellar basal-body rod protein FlgC
MAVTDVMAISEYGMHYQKMRVEAATVNIANAQVVQPSDGTGFKPLEVVATRDFHSTLFNVDNIETKGQELPNKQVFQPDHAAADANGFVHYANIDIAEQMITLTLATRAYEANIKAFNSNMNMNMKALEIGK